MRKILILLAAAMVLPAGAGEAGKGEALLQSFIGEVDTMTARFEQSLVDADGAVVEESSGNLHIQRPGRFRWSYEEPYEQLLVADGLNVWSYDADLEQVTVKPQAEVLASTPAVLLGGGGNVLDDFRLTDTFEDRGTTWLRLRPLRPDGSFESVDLGFTEGRLSRMIFLDALGQSTLIALHDVELNTALDPGLFSFAPPADADLVGQPVEAAAGS